jgi:hypothetical protein
MIDEARNEADIRWSKAVASSIIEDSHQACFRLTTAKFPMTCHVNALNVVRIIFVDMNPRRETS